MAAMSSKASIIIGFTPFHLVPMLAMLPALGGDVYFFHPMADEPHVAEAERELNFLGGCNDPRRPRIAKYIRAGRQIDKIMGRYADVGVYVPHPFNPLSNYAFFHVGHHRRFIYQDGVLNYYDAASPLASFKWRAKQRMKAAIAGLPYTIYSGHISGVNSESISGGFFTHPARIVCADKFPQLQRLDFDSGNKTGQRTADGNTLFLDQPIESIVGEVVAQELRWRTVDYVNSLGGRVFYKPHYAQKSAVSFDPTWIPLDRNLSVLPAEWVASQLAIANTVSFFTSALANITMQNSAIACHATAVNLIPITVDGRMTSLAELFSGFGVKVVPLLPK